MTFELVVTIKDALYATFGGALFLPLILISVIALILLTLKTGRALLLIVLVPLITTIFVYGPATAFFSGMTNASMAIVTVVWLGVGLVLAAIFWKMMD